MHDFVHLHVHTYYSLLDGLSSIPKLVDKAVSDGMRGMAVTDHGNMMGIKEFWNYVRDLNRRREAKGEKPFKPILGCEMYVVRNMRRLTDRDHAKGDISGNHLIVLAKNETGYHNLIKLVSKAWTEGMYSKPRTDHEELEKYHEGLIVCSACIAGEVPEKILQDDIEGAEQSALWFKRVFGEDYYLELQRHRVTDPAIDANRETYHLQEKANKGMIALARKHGIKLVCTNDSHFVDKDDAETHDRLICLSTNKLTSDPTRLLYTKQEWFKTRREMNDVFGDIPEALEGTCEVADKVEIYSIDHDPIMPFFPIPESFGTEEQWRKRFTTDQLYREFTTDYNGENPMSAEEGELKIVKLGGYDKLYRIKFEADYLAFLTYNGARTRYGDPLKKSINDRIRFELHVMKTMGFPGYFLIVQDFIGEAEKELGVTVGPGRGSVTGSVVAYCLGITKIDPLKYNLLFERFLNPDRISLPDIDTDFDVEGRARVLKWVEDKYGRDNVAHIITFGTMATKNSIRDVARVEGLPLEISNSLCKLIPNKLPKNLEMSLKNAISVIPELKEAENSSNPKLHDTIAYAKKIEGTVRNTGVHACGTIICRDRVDDWVPVSTADDKDNPGHKLLCTQYDGHVIEETGLIKMDFLGLNTLSIIRDAIDNIKLNTGKKILLEDIPLDDIPTYNLFQRGETVGTFQFESAGMQKYLRELHPTVFEDLIAMSALYRPGPMSYIPDFIDRKRGRKAIAYDIPCMEKYLKETYGITVYQEQVMLLSREIAGFTRGESDALRKAMGKKKKNIVDRMKPKFISGGINNGYDSKTLEKIWADWEAFASYAFNKSHSTGYALVAFHTAFLKAHFPSEYMAAVLSRNLDDKNELTKIMDECRRMKINIKGPDVNESRQIFSAAKSGTIRFGLSAVKGVGAMAAENIIQERDKNGSYKNIFSFIQRVNLNSCNRRVVESLVLSGAFDSLGFKREDIYGRDKKDEQFIDTLLHYGQLCQQERQQAQLSLFSGDDAVETAAPPIPDAKPWSNLERLSKERSLIGIYLSAHPLDSYRIVLDNMCNTHCQELTNIQELKDRKEITVGGFVTQVKRQLTRNGNPCGIVTLEDFEGTGELALFGKDWDRWSAMLKENDAVYIRANCLPRRQYGGYGTPQTEQTTIYNLYVKSIEELKTVKERGVNRITISLNTVFLEENMVSEMNEIISKSPGKTNIFFNLYDPEHKQHLTLRSATKTVEVTSELISYINANPAMSYRIN